ncbi:hypothetical protein H9I49_02485 [Terrabacter sp. MAHUQ-38]|nr:hypothetical protein [Terrabacter sp. MAHUQ-38]
MLEAAAGEHPPGGEVGRLCLGLEAVQVQSLERVPDKQVQGDRGDRPAGECLVQGVAHPSRLKGPTYDPAERHASGEVPVDLDEEHLGSSRLAILDSLLDAVRMSRSG